MHTILKSNTKEVVIGSDKPFVIIGEKINPTGIKKLGQALVEQNFEYVKHLAQRQVAWGAEVLDVNVGHPQIDQRDVRVAGAELRDCLAATGTGNHFETGAARESIHDITNILFIVDHDEDRGLSGHTHSLAMARTADRIARS